MSLSNYLLQSLICSLLFYGYGLGLYGKVSYVVSISIVCLIYGLQIKFSHIWIKNFYFGPVQWVWRGLTSKDFVKNKK